MEPILTRLQELLKQFKSSENNTSVSFVANDPVAIQILSIWPELPLTVQEPMVLGGPPLHKHNLWKYVWKFRKIDFRELEKKTGLDDRKILHEKIDMLVAHQLIYPDGSLSSAAQSLVSSR